MNTAYQYKTGRNNIEFATHTSKKGTCRPFVRKRPAYMDFADKCLSFIDMVLEIICSARVIVAAKAVFGFFALIGLLGIIGGIEFGKISLLTGVSCLALIVVLEFLILRDHDFEK